MMALQLPPQRMAGHDAEIAADIGEDGADRAAADLGGDLRRRGQAGEAGIGLRRGRGGRPRRAAGGSSRRGGSGRCVQTGGVAEKPGLERVGAMQAAGDAREDQRDLGGAEAGGDGAGSVKARCRIVVASSLAVVDELADEVEQAAVRLGSGVGEGCWPRRT